MASLPILVLAFDEKPKVIIFKFSSFYAEEIMNRCVKFHCSLSCNSAFSCRYDPKNDSLKSVQKQKSYGPCGGDEMLTETIFYFDLW